MHQFASTILLILLLLSVAQPPLASQTRRTPRKPAGRAAQVKARSLPVRGASFAMVAPTVEAGQALAARYPADGHSSVPAHVFHGGRPGPVIALLFHGFETEEAFHQVVEQIFGAIPRATLQGTILALQFPARSRCEGAKPCAPAAESEWMQLAPRILNDSRFLVDVHLGVAGVSGEPYAFVYLPHEDRRLATYVSAMAQASLIPNVVELRESELEGKGLSAKALQHLAPESLALSHPAIAVEASTLSGQEGERLRKGLANLLDHLKMASGGVSWQNSQTPHALADLPAGFFAPKE